MASKYGVITVAIFEDFISEDLSVIDPVLLSDTKVEAKITAAEEFVFGYIGITLSSPFEDGIIYSVKVISARIIYKWMREQGMMLDKQQVLESKKPFITPDIEVMLSKYQSKSLPIKLHRLYSPTVYY